MPDKEKPFVHLHAHTHYSLLDGCAKVDRYMERCKELNMPAIAMTDHGNLFGAMDFYQAATKAGIKPLIGCEVYLVHDHKQADRPKRDRKRSDDIDDIPEDELSPSDFPRNQIHHKTLIAKNFTGYQNLVRLVSDAHVNGQYYRPRTDMEKLAQYSEGIIGLSGCVNGVASQYLIYNDYENARKATAQFIDIFGREDYYIEIQDHGIGFQRRILPGLLKLAKEFDLKVVCTNDVHYVERDDAQPHDALLCIQTGKLVQDADRMKYPCNEFYLKPRSEMEKLFAKDAPESFDNTVELAEKVDIKIEFGQNHYPVYERPVEVSFASDEDAFDRVLDVYVREKNKVLERDGEQPIALSKDERAQFRKNGLYLFDLCKQGLKERYGVDYDAVRKEHPEHLSPDKPGQGEFDPESDTSAREICDKLEYELGIITGAGFVDYFLITWDFINWARSQEIPVGPGRGSGAGCMVAYILKITDIDPLRFGLLFERMLSLERVSPPDFDVDFCMRRRDDVVDYVREKYGKDCVANIITFGTFGAKMIVRDLARVHNVPYAEADRLAKMVPDELNISLEDAVNKSGELKAEVQNNATASRIYKEGKVIEGMVRNTGKHACGIIVGDQPLTNLVPVTLQEGDLTTQYPKDPVEALGMLKCDFLGLKTLTVIADAQENVRRTTGQPKFDIEKVPLGDEPTFALLNSGRTTGVFQLESGGMQALCRQIGISSFEEIIALIALYRPGPMQFIPQYIEGKKDPSKIQIPHPKLTELVGETYGILVYQEQVMEVARLIAGYTLGGADILRRAMGKKKPEVMAQQKAIFLKGAKETTGLEAKPAEEIFNLLEKFAQYGFNKSHSAAYAMLSYRTAYLKANYPVQFMAAVLSCELGNADKLAHFIEECAAMKIDVLRPDINESRENFTPLPAESGEGGAIRFGLAAVKGVGDGAAHAILTERDANGAFKDIHDFVTRLGGKAVNKRVLECLIKTGAFDETGYDRAHLLASVDALMTEAASAAKDREAGQGSLFDMLDDVGDMGGGTQTPIRTDLNELPMIEKLQFEKELLGFYVSGHPMNPYKGLDDQVSNLLPEDMERIRENTPFRLCGVATNIAKKLTRKDNRPWVFFQLATRQAVFQINVFPDTFESYQHLIEDGALLCVEGEARWREERSEVSLSAQSLHRIEDYLPALLESVTFVLGEDYERDEAFLLELSDYISANDGNTQLRVAVKLDDGRLVEAQFPQSRRCIIRPEAFQKLRKHEAVIDIEVEAPQPQLQPRNFRRGGARAGV